MIVAIDAGHGHNTAGKRCPDDSMREHDFNGNVATKVCNILNKNGIDTFRSDDITGNTDVPLNTRTNNINAKGAILCVSIHANAFTGKWNTANGIETYVYKKGGEAEKLANIIQRRLIEVTGRRNRGVKMANLHMCRETKMTAILCECGFMDNKEEAELLKSEDYRAKCAEAIAYGIFEYLNIELKPESKEPVQQPVEQPTQNGYLVKIVNCSALNVRAGAGTKYKVNTTVKKNEVYTIVDEKNGWGKLKSGAGWISLKYTKKC